MANFVIEGQHRLQGSIAVAGMKNAATPVIAATLLTEEECVIRNVPKILDVFKMVDLLQSLGAEAAWSGEHELTIRCKDVDPGRLQKKAVKALRSSVLLLGPLIARFPEVTIAQPGGCIIGNRPLDTHFAALQALGVTIREQKGELFVTRDQLHAANVVLPEFSVTATENLLMAASLIPDSTTIDIAAAEPHVQNLGAFLQSMGVAIKGLGTHTIRLRGAQRLHGAVHTIIPDQIEVGTWAVAAAVTRGTVDICNVEPDHLKLILLKLRQAGVSATLNGTTLSIRPSGRLKAFRLQTLPYPGFPTDLQAPFAVLATQAEGTSLIQDPLFEGRMGYVQELVKMGANAVVCDPHRVLITGPTPLYGQEIRSFDLRAGATLIIAGLLAQGETIIHDAEIVDRGYEAIDQRLQALGANITRHATT